MKTSILTGLALFTLLSGCAATQHVPSVPLEQQVEQQAVAFAPGATRVGQLFAGAGPKMDYSVQLERGQCYWFTGVTDESGEALSLYLWGPPYGKRLTDSRSPTASSTMGHCPIVSGMYRFQAKTKHEGSFVVGLYAKEAPEGSLPPVAAAYAQPNRPAYGAVYARPVYAPGYGGAVVVGTPGYGVGVGVVATQPTECRMGSDGINTCGYNCQMGSNGHFYCSTIPGGTCALNSDGSWSCP